MGKDCGSRSQPGQGLSPTGLAAWFRLLWPSSMDRTRGFLILLSQKEVLFLGFRVGSFRALALHMGELGLILITFLPGGIPEHSQE